MKRSKKELNIKSVLDKTRGAYSGFFEKIMFRSDRFLMFIFLIFVALWMFVFWKYVYEVYNSTPVVSVNVLKVKKDALNAIVEDIEKREVIRSDISLDGIKNPFLDKELPIQNQTNE